MKTVKLDRGEIERSELPFLTKSIVQLRLANAERRAAEESYRAAAYFARRHEVTYGPTGWRALAKIHARSARIARQYAQLYREFLAEAAA